jgi:transcriptional regulator with XRE-family HTH domain
MIDQITSFEDGDLALPRASLDLSARMRDLRARLGLKQSEVARRMRLDPSIPSLWEQGKRLVPANRVRALADALEVSLDELLEGVSGAHRVAPKLPLESSARPGVSDLIDERAGRSRAADTGPSSLVLHAAADVAVAEPPVEPVIEPWVVAPRPPLEGWIPEGWEPADRVQDISPSLPDGYWLDPVKLEKSTPRQLLRSRLCAEDRSLIGERDVPGAAMAERLYRHCGREDSFLTSARLPLAEMIFRCVVMADHGGLTDEVLIDMLRERSGAPVSTTLLRRLRDSVRPYPIRRVDADLFGGRR